MTGRTTLLTAPTVEPVTFAEMQGHSRITGTADQTLVERQITAARQYAEGVQGRGYITQTWTLTLDAFPDVRYIELPGAPLQSVTHVQYTPDGGVLTTFAAASYIVDLTRWPGRITLGTDYDWPADELVADSGVIVTYKIGYGDAATAVPVTIRQALMLIVAHWYEHREEVSEETLRQVPLAARNLLQHDRVFSFV